MKQIILLGFVIAFLFFGSAFLFFGSIFLLFGHTMTQAAYESDTAQIDPNAFVYILDMGIISGDALQHSTIQYGGLRNGFAVGNGQYILTAAHCVDGFVQDSTEPVLCNPFVVSPYYGDAFGVRIVAVDADA